jgi:hypothetical protein
MQIGGMQAIALLRISSSYIITRVIMVLLEGKYVDSLTADGKS